MKPRTEATSFGSITVDGEKFNHDALPAPCLPFDHHSGPSRAMAHDGPETMSGIENHVVIKVAPNQPAL